MVNNNENTLSCLLYVISLAWIFPMSNFILPLILWLLIKHKHENINLHGKNLLNFQITYGFGVLIFWLLSLFPLINRDINLSFIVLALLIAMLYVPFCTIGAIMAYRGKMIHCPLVYKFIK